MSAAAQDIRVVRNSSCIEPVSSHNLHCRMCGANVINAPHCMVREAGPALDFVRRVVAKAGGRLGAYWCVTGEVFLHRDFPWMVDTLAAEFPHKPSPGPSRPTACCAA